jgi:beta-fructofuranosidase
LWRPDLVYAPECSDLFCDDGQWTLIYSWGQTRLRRAPSLEGPWTAPAIDSVDGHPFYAAKTLHDGRRRILLGWIALREGESDDGRWRWGGRMGLPRELGFDADGNVRTRPVDEVVKAFARLVFSPKEANAAATNASAWKTEGKDVVVDAAEGALHLHLADLPATCLVTCRVQFSRMAASGGLLLRMSEGADAGYSLMVEPARQRVILRGWSARGGKPLIDRPLRVEAGRWVRMQVFMQDTVVEVFLDDRVALSCRMYDRRSGWLGLLAQNGRVRFADLAVRAME